MTPTRCEWCGGPLGYRGVPDQVSPDLQPPYCSTDCAVLDEAQMAAETTGCCPQTVAVAFHVLAQRLGIR